MSSLMLPVENAGPEPTDARFFDDGGWHCWPEQDPHGHMTAAEARELFRASGARRLLLTHRATELPLEELVYEGFELELDP